MKRIDRQGRIPGLEPTPIFKWLLLMQLRPGFDESSLTALQCPCDQFYVIHSHNCPKSASFLDNSDIRQKSLFRERLNSCEKRQYFVRTADVSSPTLWLVVLLCLLCFLWLLSRSTSLPRKNICHKRHKNTKGHTCPKSASFLDSGDPQRKRQGYRDNRHENLADSTVFSVRRTCE